MKIPDGIQHYPVGARMPLELEHRLQEYAYRYGDTYASYLATDEGWETVWLADGGGVLRFARWGGCYAMVVGGLLAPPEKQEALLAGFLELARQNRWHVGFYNVDRERLPLFR